MEILSLDFYHFLKKKLLILFFLCAPILEAQQNFKLPYGVKSDKIKFTLVNNLIVIPVELNGVQLSFILDTGVGSTILFSLADTESIELNNTTKIVLRGLGDDEPVEAIKSQENTLQIGESYNNKHTVYLVFDESINFSPRMGFPIHGIIGYDFFKEFILEINYTKKTIKINDPASHTYKKCKKCFVTDLDFSNNQKRPLVKASYTTKDNSVPINLLIDSGSSSALWLFEEKKKNIVVPDHFFEAFLGRGFNGDIYGKKTKIEELAIGDFMMKEVTASFPDSVYVKEIATDRRQGSIGGGILKRFNLIVDYPNRKISFKKNNYFSKPFFYNMSGLTIQHTGLKVSESRIKIDKGFNRPSLNFLSKEAGEIAIHVLKANINNFGYDLVPRYEISDVRPDSPAAIAGLKSGDEIIQINGKLAERYKLSDINNLFYEGEGKRIKIKVNRLGVIITYIFYLKRVI